MPSETKCRGAATGHSEDFRETWVPLLEKAVAKVGTGDATEGEGVMG